MIRRRRYSIARQYSHRMLDSLLQTPIRMSAIAEELTSAKATTSISSVYVSGDCFGLSHFPELWRFDAVAAVIPRHVETVVCAGEQLSGFLPIVGPDGHADADRHGGGGGDGEHCLKAGQAVDGASGCPRPGAQSFHLGWPRCGPAIRWPLPR